MTRQPCQTGSERPRPSRSRASPISIASTVTLRPIRQIVCPATAAARQIAVVGKEPGKGFGRSHDNQVAGVNIDERVDGVETDWHAGAGVPDDPRRAIVELRERRGAHAEQHDRERCAAADHGATLWRMSQALWRASV